MNARLFDHVDLRVRNLAEARAFYSVLLPALGFPALCDTPHGIALDAVRKHPKPEFIGLIEDPGHVPNSTRLAFWAETAADVDRIGRLLQTAGARNIEGPMSCAEYSPNYYGVFFEDPCGNRLEVCCRTVGLEGERETLERALDLRIRVDDLRGPEIAALLSEHLECMARVSPPESVHALDLERLRQPEITFWTAWDGSRLAGCGALKELDPGHGELKSMRTASGYRRRGVARRMLEHILMEARRRGYRRVSLETGAMPYFEPARSLYASAGFSECEPFGSYRPDPNSRFFTRLLQRGPEAESRFP